jgi:hypothetical protein
MNSLEAVRFLVREVLDLGEMDKPGFHQLPDSVKRRAMSMFDKAHEDKVGETDVIDGHHLESHTIGCMRYGDVPEDKCWDKHYDLHDSLKKHPQMVTYGDPSEGKFISIGIPKR